MQQPLLPTAQPPKRHTDPAVEIQPVPLEAAACAKPKTRFGGVIAALPTPCNAPGRVDPSAMARLCRQLVDEGCHGLFVASSTGEMAVLDEIDRRNLVAATREGVGRDATVYAGVSALGIRQTVQFARNAAADGADVAIAMAPFFMLLSQQELLAYYRELADASPIPIGIYHHKRMLTSIDVETIAKLAEHPNIALCKDTSMNLARTQQMAKAIGDTTFSLLQGNEVLFLPSLQAGGHGCICALAGVAPKWHREVYESWHRADLDESQRAQQKIHELTALFALPQIADSLAHFTYAVRRCMVAFDWIPSAYGMVPGFTPDPSFDHAILMVLRDTGLFRH